MRLQLLIKLYTAMNGLICVNNNSGTCSSQDRDEEIQRLCLSDFNVSTKYGFMVEDPLITKHMKNTIHAPGSSEHFISYFSREDDTICAGDCPSKVFWSADIDRSGYRYIDSRFLPRMHNTKDHLTRHLLMVPDVGQIICNFEGKRTDLPPYFSAWMEIANNLQALIRNDTLREEVHQMPLLDHTKLVCYKEWSLAHVVLSFISNGYVWIRGEEHIPRVLPRNLAIPYAGVCSYLGVPPSFSHCSSVLANWKLKDPRKPVELDNLDTIVKVAGGSDEAWFFMVAGAVEIECAPGLQAILKAQEAVADCKVEELKESLREMEYSLQQMKRALSRMHEGCDPDVFYNGLRPFLAGWASAGFKNQGLRGLIYEDVSDEPMTYVGGSAAQSSSVPAFDAALSIEHTVKEEKFRQAFQEYMPPAHRAFVNAIANGPSIRRFVENSQNAEVQEAYNQCLTALKDFRTQHVQIVTRYIIIMSNKKSRNLKFANQAKAGTGGTGFMKFLKSLRNATADSILTSPTEEEEEQDKVEEKKVTMNGTVATEKKDMAMNGTVAMNGTIAKEKKEVTMNGFMKFLKSLSYATADSILTSPNEEEEEKDMVEEKKVTMNGTVATEKKDVAMNGTVANEQKVAMNGTIAKEKKEVTMNGFMRFLKSLGYAAADSILTSPTEEEEEKDKVEEKKVTMNGTVTTEKKDMAMNGTVAMNGTIAKEKKEVTMNGNVAVNDTLPTMQHKLPTSL